MKIALQLGIFILTANLLQAAAPTKEAIAREDLRHAGATQFQSENANTFSVFVKGFC